MQKLPDAVHQMSDEDLLAECTERTKTACDSFTYNSKGFHATISTDHENLVFFSVPWEEGWSAEVNGEPVAIEKADIGFMAVPVAAGDSEITFTYHTPGLKAGALLSLGGLVLFAGYLTVAGIYNKRHPNPKTESICCVDYSTEETDGKIVQRDVVHHSGGVCVVPLTERQTVLMVQQYRYPFHEVTLEIPAGKREPGEDPLECGLRELREEVGRTCKKYTELGYLYPTPAYDTEVIHMYLAEDLSAPMQQDLDAGEFLDVLELPLEEVVTMIMDGKIADAKTQLAILKTWALLQIQGKK